MDTIETLSDVADQVQSKANQTMDGVSARAKKVRANISGVGDSVVSFTEENPITAIVIAAGVGALIVILLSAFQPNRD